MGGQELMQAVQRAALTGFHLDGTGAAIARDQVIGLRRSAALFARPGVEFPVLGNQQLLCDELLGELAAVDGEQVLLAQLHIRRQMRQPLHQSDIDQRRFEAPAVDTGAERQSRRPHGWDLVQDLRPAQQIERLVYGGIGAALRKPRVLDLIRDSGGAAVEHLIQALLVRTRRVLRKILSIGTWDLRLDLEGLQHRAVEVCGAHGLRHAADEEIPLELLEQQAVRHRGERRRRPAQNVVKRCVAPGQDELDEREGRHVQKLHPPHGKEHLTPREFQERAGGHDVQIGNALVQIAERAQRARAGLDLVEKE